MIIRVAQKNDLRSIADLAREIIEYHHALDPYFKSSAGYKDLQKDLGKELADRDGLFLVAEDSGVIIGYFRGSIDDSPGYVAPKRVGVVYDILVTEKYRQRGVGEVLFGQALIWFRSKKIRYIELNVAARNTAGIKFWRKLGFDDYKIRMKRDL